MDDDPDSCHAQAGLTCSASEGFPYGTMGSRSWLVSLSTLASPWAALAFLYENKPLYCKVVMST